MQVNLWKTRQVDTGCDIEEARKRSGSEGRRASTAIGPIQYLTLVKLGAQSMVKYVPEVQVPQHVTRD